MGGISSRHLSSVLREPLKVTGIVGIVVLAGVIAFLAGCSLPSPQSPTWTTEVTVPLANKLYDIPYIVDHADQPELVWDSISGARFEVSRELDTIFIENNIRFESLTEGFSRVLGTFELEPDEHLETAMLLSDLIGGSPDNVPPLGVTVEKDFQPFTEIQHAKVVQATIRLTLTNSFAIDYDSVALSIHDKVSGQPLGLAVFPAGVAASGSASADLDLSDVSVGNQLALSLYARTPGGNISHLDANELQIEAEFYGPVEVSEASATIPAITRNYSDTIALSNDYQASAATFSGGHISIDVQNNLPLATSLELTLPDLTSGGLPLSAGGSIGPQGSTTLTFDLAGVSYSNAQAGSTPLRVEAAFDSPGSPTPVTVTASNQFTVESEVLEPVIESITGILPEVTKSITDLQTEIDLPDGFEEAGLAAGELQLEILSSLPYPGSFDLRLSGDRQQSLLITGDILPASGETPIASQVNVANAASLLSPIPQLIRAEGSVVYGDGVTAGTVTRNDYFVPSFQLTAPLRLYLDNIEYEGEIEGISLADDSDELDNRFGQATITAEFDNALPFGVTAELFLSNKRSDLPDNPVITLGPTTIEPAVTDAEGQTVSPTTTQAVFTVREDQSYIFESDSLFITERIHLFTPEGASVLIRDSDYLSWRAMMQVETEMGEREW